jgi:hypothetical protein
MLEFSQSEIWRDYALDGDRLRTSVIAGVDTETPLQKNKEDSIQRFDSKTQFNY